MAKSALSTRQVQAFINTRHVTHCVPRAPSHDCNSAPFSTAAYETYGTSRRQATDQPVAERSSRRTPSATRQPGMKRAKTEPRALLRRPRQEGGDRRRLVSVPVVTHYMPLGCSCCYCRRFFSPGIGICGRQAALPAGAGPNKRGRCAHKP
jgi:hypothetical protein